MTYEDGAILKKMALAGCVLVMIAVVAPVMAQDNQSREFDIDKKELGEALTEFGIATGNQVLFKDADVRGKTANDLKGVYTSREAVEALLENTGVAYRVDDNGTLLVGSEYVRRASLGEESTRSFQVAELQSNDQSNDEPREIKEDNGFDEEQVQDVMDVIVVTGTNIRGVQNPTTPVVQLSRDDIELSGAVSVADLARLIPQNFAANTPLSTNSQNPFDQNANNSAQGTAFDLRGLGAGSTLVLLNGRRLGNTGNSSFFDVSVLPLDVIDRVDVLTDGASAIYGSDAVGGVVNFITRYDYEGFELRATYGSVADAGSDYRIGVTGGASWHSGGAFVSAEYLESDRLELRDRSFVDVSIANPNGTLLPERKGFNIAGSISQNLTSRTSASLDVVYNQSDRNSVNSLFNTATSEIDVSSLFILGSVSYELSKDWGAEAFFDYGSNETARTIINDNSIAENIDENRIMALEGRVSGRLLDLPGGTVSTALGISYRKENYETPTSGSILLDDPEREVFAAYGEILVPIIGIANGIPLVQRLDLSVAGRYEDYSDFGETTNPKLGAHWEITDGLSLRGTYGQSFRAPPLIDSFRQPEVVIGAFPRSFFPNNGVIPQNPNAPIGTIVLIGGSQPGGVTEERAESWSAGVEYSPAFEPSLDVDLNYFSVSYTDRVRLVSLGEVLFFPEFNDLLTYNPDPTDVAAILSIPDAEVFGSLPFEFTETDFQAFGPSGLINLTEVEVDGIDFGVSYTLDTDLGSIRTRLDASYALNYDIKTTPSSESVDTAGLVFRPAELSLRGSIAWSKGPYTLFSAVNYISGVENDQVNPIENVDDFTTVDLVASYEAQDTTGSFLDGVRVGLNVQNLFDEDPPFARTNDGLNFDAANASPLGRVVSIQFRKRF